MYIRRNRLQWSYGIDRCCFQCALLIFNSLVYKDTCCPFILPAVVVIHSKHDRTLSWNLYIFPHAAVYYYQWCITCMLSIKHTVDISKSKLCSVNVIWHMRNTRSATISQQSVTSVDHNDNIWCGPADPTADLRDVYMSAQLMSFSTISIQRVSTTSGSIVYIVHTHRRSHYHPHGKNYIYRQLLWCYCSASRI